MSRILTPAVTSSFVPSFAVRPTALASLAFLAFSASTLAQAQVAGTIEFVQGAAVVRTSAGAQRVVQRGTTVSNGETVDTQTGRLQMRMVDGAYMSLQNNTVLRLEDYKFNQPGAEDRGFMALVRGGLRTVTGLIGRSNKSAYKLQTATATIGIRGTGYSATADDEGVRVKVSEGAINMCNDGGCLDVGAQQSGFAPASSVRPVLVAAAPKLPPVEAPKPVTVAVKVDPVLAAQTTPSIVFNPGPAPYLINIADPDTESLTTDLYVAGTATFDAATRMIKFRVDGEGSLYVATPAEVVEYQTDGIMAWGRWAGGNTNGAPLNSLSYAVGTTTPPAATPIGNATYNVTASTAPVGASSAGQVLGTGAPNTVTGSLAVSFPGSTGGNLTYVLNVPYNSFNYVLNGTANQAGAASFSGGSGLLTSKDGGCLAAPCLTGSNPFQGFFTGANAERAGANYRFTINYTNIITGVVVLTRQSSNAGF